MPAILRTGRQCKSSEDVACAMRSTAVSLGAAQAVHTQLKGGNSHKLLRSAEALTSSLSAVLPSFHGMSTTRVSSPAASTLKNSLSAALVIAGHARHACIPSCAQGLAAQVALCRRRFAVCDVFLVIWDAIDGSTWLDREQRLHAPALTEECHTRLLELLAPVGVRVRNASAQVPLCSGTHLRKFWPGTTVCIDAVQLMRRSIDIGLGMASRRGVQYDVAVRMRPDSIAPTSCRYGASMNDSLRRPVDSCFGTEGRWDQLARVATDEVYRDHLKLAFWPRTAFVGGDNCFAARFSSLRRLVDEWNTVLRQVATRGELPFEGPAPPDCHDTTKRRGQSNASDDYCWPWSGHPELALELAASRLSLRLWRWSDSKKVFAQQELLPCPKTSSRC